jgi:hypothetical protein
MTSLFAEPSEHYHPGAGFLNKPTRYDIAQIHGKSLLAACMPFWARAFRKFPSRELLQDQDVSHIKTRRFIFLAAAKEGAVPKTTPKGTQLLSLLRV